MLTRWEPFGSIRRKGRNVFGELTGMQEEMNRMFDEFFGERNSHIAEGSWVPAVDVSESESAMTIRAELPGMKQENIELNLQDNVLTLRGEKTQEQKEENENFHRVERSYGSFCRSFTLSANVEQENVQANFKQGILEIVLPKTEEAKPKKIEIAVGP